MMKLKEKLNMFLIAALLACLSVGALGEEVLMSIQAISRAKKFTADTVSQEDLDLILKAGISTVVQLDRQPWQFTAITDAQVLDQLADDCENMLNFEDNEEDSATDAIREKMSEMIENLSDEISIGDAPAAIVIYADDSSASPNESFDCGMAVQNMILTASTLGYGTSVISGPLSVLNGENHDTYCMQFGVDSNMNAVAVLLLGAAEEFSSEEYNLDELLIEKVSYVQ